MAEDEADYDISSLEKMLDNKYEINLTAEGDVETTDAKTGENYSINKIQIRPGNPIDPTKDKFAALYLTQMPNLPSKKAEYVPMPYTFRVKAPSNRIKINNLKARCPPFYVLLDHTIAVIWLLFAQEGEFECSLGIAQVQWALAFLKTFHTREGDRPRDVQICIDALENLLVDQYADLTSEVSAMDKLDETVHYLDGALGSNSMLTETVPFSLNYSELFNKCPELQQQPVVPCKSMTSTEAIQKLEKITKAAGVASIEQLDSVSKEKAINILKCWKTDQVEKIREELRRLRSIEDKMKDIDDNFDGYIEDDMEMLYPK